MTTTTDQATNPAVSTAPSTDRTACTTMFSHFLEHATDEEVDLFDSVLRERAEHRGDADTLRAIMSREAYYGGSQPPSASGADSERQAFQAFIDVYRANMGAHTPAENFIAGLVLQFAVRKTVTPDDAARLLEQFREEYEMTVDAARRLLRRNPQAFADIISNPQVLEARP